MPELDDDFLTPDVERWIHRLTHRQVDLSPHVYRLRANVAIAIRDARTEVLRRTIRGHNLVVNVGLAAIAAGFTGTAPTITHIGYGSGSTAAAAGDTALQTQIVQYPITQVASSGAVATAQHYLSSGLLNGSTIREIGLFASGALIARFVFSDADFQPKTSAVVGLVTWTMTGSAS